MKGHNESTGCLSAHLDRNGKKEQTARLKQPVLFSKISVMSKDGKSGSGCR